VKKPKIALKPYLDTIAGYCNTLSNQELTDILIRLARDIPTSGRVEFLKKIESYIPGHRLAIMPDTDTAEQILGGIEALKENIEERIRSIEDGSYWDDPDFWADDGYYEEEPDYISEDQNEELGSFFEDAERLFLDDRLEDARKVYGALFNLIHAIEEEGYFSPPDEIDIREARARYCRCVYETSNTDKRLDEFVGAMEVDVSNLYHENEYDEDYPLMQDVIDAKPGEMKDLESFLPTWEKSLITKGTKGRPAGLLLETVHRLEGINGASRLAKEWENSQPQGYLFWLKILKKENDQKGIIHVSREGLKALKEGKPRERVAEFMMDAAKELHDAKHILLGRRERFFSYMSDQNLLDLVDEATTQGKRDNELDTVIKFFEGRRAIDEGKELYARALLMSGNLNSAFALAKNEKGVGWSSGNNAGVVFGAVLSVLADHSEKAGTIKTFLKDYANKRTIYSERFSIDDGKSTSFYNEIIKGLTQNKETKSQAAEYFSWAEKIGTKRIEHIVSNKHRRAYERAAQVLASLAEAYLAMGQQSKAAKILHSYYNEKYNRFSAFRKEVKAVVKASDLLRNSGFLK
jgi:thioredoxin-like negative regulator of GroEL